MRCGRCEDDAKVLINTRGFGLEDVCPVCAVAVISDGQCEGLPQPNADHIESAEQARDLAVDWQGWQSTRSMSYLEVFRWHDFFEGLAEKFGLVDEFKENGIIGGGFDADDPRDSPTQEEGSTAGTA